MRFERLGDDKIQVNVSSDDLEKNNIDLPIYTLTEVGKNIFEILSPIYDECFFEKYIGIIKNEMNISHSTIIKKLPNGQIKYEKPVTNVK